ncbi:MAG TPA: hypothetical protein VEI02_13405 [Planctomycetota bacterium]|nr:hypothetical protein [Planctomycetota bacterium]
MAHSATSSSRRGPFRFVDDLLRARRDLAPDAEGLPWVGILSVIVVCGFGYGFTMGAWGLGTFGFRPKQALFSGLKVPILLTLAPFVCLPNFFVVNTVLGLRDDFATACRGVLASQAVVAATLLALAPVTATGYASVADYATAVAINGAQFLVASVAGQIALARYYRRLIARDRRHRAARNAWLVLYVFVAIQLAWVLRPFVGAPTIRTSFFRQEAWSNAYVVVAEVVVSVVTGK